MLSTSLVCLDVVKATADLLTLEQHPLSLFAACSASEIIPPVLKRAHGWSSNSHNEPLAGCSSLIFVFVYGWDFPSEAVVLLLLFLQHTEKVYCFFSQFSIPEGLFEVCTSIKVFFSPLVKLYLKTICIIIKESEALFNCKIIIIKNETSRFMDIKVFPPKTVLAQKVLM